MFWDKISGLYDFFETAYNGRVYKNLGKFVAAFIDEKDMVLECACGTGAITHEIAPVCKKLIATDFSKGMLSQAQRHCKDYSNVEFRHADITSLSWENECFQKVVAGNVVHLLDQPYAAIDEMLRVCQKSGKVIIPTYINKTNTSSTIAAKVLDMFGADFKRQFDFNSYQQFFDDGGYTNVSYSVVDGRMPCAIAVITKC